MIILLYYSVQEHTCAPQLEHDEEGFFQGFPVDHVSLPTVLQV